MKSYRIGYGEDIHRLVKGHDFVLGGVKITPTDVMPLAHSDGDVIYHAVSDALLGALALGDIGVYFPPSDKKTKGMDSRLIVEKCLSLVKAKGYHVVNADVSVILEKPHLRPLIEGMQANLASLLEVADGAASVKAGTNEGLDALGEGKAIKAVAVVLLEKEK
jgi:2-C-methyl-D-erythritol 2,4-cyclodiphosphate synthase